jgi:hypothetical protein
VSTSPSHQSQRPAGLSRGPGPRTVWTRRLVALAIGVVLVLLLLLLVRGCRGAREESAVKDYVRDLSSLTSESGQGSATLFGLLRNPGRRGPVELLTDVNGSAVQAAQLVERARDLDPPDRLTRAHGYVIEALEFRRDGLATVGRVLPSALGDAGRGEATARLAAAMQGFLVSDVLYSRRVQPVARRALAGEDYASEVDIPGGRFLPDLEWLRPPGVDARLARARRAGDGAGARPAPGLHGTGLAAVTIGGQPVAPGRPARIPRGGDRTARVRIQNQGESPERDVTVRVRIAGAGEPIEFERAVEQLEVGAAETVTIPLAGMPPPGRPVTISVVVEPVPGEKKVENNRVSAPAVFVP